MGGAKYSVKLLKETSHTKDLFEDQTHQKVADTLFNIIDGDSSEGITIGLEGGWGGGKSTIVSLLKKRIDSDKSKIRYFYFDAWAHEGDPLRRIFLEKMINQLADKENKELLSLKEKISKRKKESRTKTKRTVTKLGMWLAISSFFVPFGVAIVSGTASEVVFWWTGRIHWTFSLGMALSFIPLLVVICNIVKIIRSKKTVWDPSNWMFLQGERTSVETQEISEEEERSSVEFEKYFGTIIRNVLKEENSKLLIVIDNLDRISRDDSLKVWSTLQTYLQRLNPCEDTFPELAQVWTLVPYDESGLRKLWDVEVCRNAESVEKQSCSDSFFDKCFQLRIEVPPLVISGWEAFCRHNMNIALVGWSLKEKSQAISVLSWSRKGVTDTPSPRGIKIFINQIGILRTHVNTAVSVEAVAYYAVRKYMAGDTTLELEKKLVSKELPSDRILHLFQVKNIVAEISAIIFGVSPEKGEQLLLEPEIERKLSNADSAGLKKLRDMHKAAFWIVFDLHINKVASMKVATEYAAVVVEGLWKKDKASCKAFSSVVASFVNEWESGRSLFPKKPELDNYCSLLKLILESKGPIDKMCSIMQQSFVQICSAENFDSDFAVLALSRLGGSSGGGDRLCIEGKSLSYESLEKIILSADSLKIDLSENINLPETFLDDINARIPTGKPLPSELLIMVEFAKHKSMQDWKPVIDGITRHIKWNSGGNPGQQFTSDVFRLIEILIGISSEVNDDLLKLITEGSLWNLAYQFAGEGAVKDCALLLARLTDGVLDGVPIPHVGQSAVALDNARNWWNASSRESALYVWNKIESLPSFHFLWVLAADPTKALVGRIIEVAMEKECSALFCHPEAYPSYINAFKLVDSKFKELLAESFISWSEIESEVTEVKTIELGTYPEEILSLLEKSKNLKFASKIADEFGHYSSTDWTELFYNSNDEQKILLELVSRKIEIPLTKPYYDAFLKVTLSWMDGSRTPSKFQLENLITLFSIMPAEYQEHFGTSVSSCLNENGYVVIDSMKGFVLSLFAREICFIDGKRIIQTTVEKGLEARNLDLLGFISELLTLDKTGLFKPDKRLSKVLKEPFFGILAEVVSKSNKEEITVVQHLMEKFNVELPKQGAK